MISLTDKFINENPREESETDSQYLERFFTYLGEEGFIDLDEVETLDEPQACESGDDGESCQ